MKDAPKTVLMNHALTPQQMLSMLRASPLFSELFPEEFQRVIGLVEIRHAPAGTTFIEEKSDDADLYMLRRGRVRAYKMPREKSRPVVRFHLPGDLLNESAFLGGSSGAEWTAEAVDNVEAWIIPAQHFHALVLKMSDMDTRLNWSNRDPEVSEGEIVTLSSEFDNQRDGERLLWRGRRDQLMFFADAWLAWLLIAAALIAAVIAVLPNAPDLLASTPAMITRIVMLIAGFAIAAWNYIDWRNDDYIISDQRVIHRERVLLLVDQQDECPLEKVQNVQVRRPTFFSTLLDLGDVTIEAQGARANVVFRWVRHPENVARLVLGHTSRLHERRQALEKAQMQQALRKALTPNNAAHDAAHDAGQNDENEPQADTPRQQQQPSRAQQIYRWLIPPMRELRGTDIIYHKHWLLLIRTTGVPMLTFLLSVALQIIVPQLGLQTPAFLQDHLPQLAGIALSLGLLGWLIWRYEDWRNDVYIVTTDRVIDYDRSPFGFAGTQQKTAGMNGIQNVAYQTRGILDNLFNMGDVVIRTGGADGELIFERVWNPRRVQREIVDRLEEFQRSQHQSQQTARRREITEWLTAYDQITTTQSTASPPPSSQNRQGRA
jgi:hypothetical protein